MSTEFHRWARMVFLLSLVLSAVSLSRIHACQICLPIPTTSAAEHLIEAEVVVLAREDPQNPFSLRAVDVLKGDLGDAKIDLFLDSSSRRSLSLNSKRKIICVYRSRDSKPEWLRIGTADAAFTPLVHEVLERAEQWKDNPKDRVAYFAKFLGNQNPQVRTLAHLEVARAPYDQIVQFAGAIPVQVLRTFLKNFRLFEWHALYILLLAQSGEAQDHQLIAEKVRTAGRFKTTVQLAPWVTAWIEIDPDAALDFLEDHYLQDSGRAPDEIRAVFMALSVHGNKGHVELRDRFVDAYRSILGSHPVLAPEIVRDLVAWERWDGARTVEAVLSSPPASLDRGALLQLRAYVNRAGENESASGSEPSETQTPAVLFGLAALALILVPVALGILNRNRRSRRLQSSP